MTDTWILLFRYYQYIKNKSSAIVIIGEHLSVQFICIVCDKRCLTVLIENGSRLGSR